MICGFKEKFQDGTPTLFKEKIIHGFMEHKLSFHMNPEKLTKTLNSKDFDNIYRSDIDSSKIHTIRAGSRWREGLTIQMASGNRFKKPGQKVWAEVPCTGVQDIKIEFSKSQKTIEHIQIDRYFYPKGRLIVEILAKNDGLTVDQFTEWFYQSAKPINTPGVDLKVFHGQIVWWVDKKY